MSQVRYQQKIKYIREIKRLLDIIGSQFRVLRKHQQFLFWFMWFNFKWDGLSEKPPKHVLEYLCDNRNDQSIDAFYFDDKEHVVYLVQSKFTANWINPGRITYAELKRTSDIIKYFESPNNDSVIYQKANQRCRELLGKASVKIQDEGYEPRIILVSNKLEPDPSNLRKLEEQAGISLKDWKFEIFDREKLIGLCSEFLEGHNPPIPAQFLRTIDDKYLYIPNPERGIEAYVAIAPADVFIDLYNKYGNRIFEKNVRSFLGEREVNKKIRETLEKEQDLFFYKNSGITILGDEIEVVNKKQDQEPGFYVKDIQIINGQQTVRVLAEHRHTQANVLMIIMAPCKDRRSVYQANVEKGMTVGIIAARNFQNKIGYSDLRSNHPRQVTLWRELKERGYYYQRKRNGWKNLDYYARALYPLASSNKWAVIKKEDLAAVTLAKIDDPQLPYQGADYIFRDRYDDVFPEKLPPVDWYLALYLLWKRYIYKVGQDLEDTYPQYHILNTLSDLLGLNTNNATDFRKAFEQEKLDKSLITATKILYELCKLVVKEQQKESEKELGTNDVFGKKRNVLKEIHKIFDSRKFKKRKAQFFKCINKFKNKLK